MTRTGDREIRSVSGRLPDNPGELACMQVPTARLVAHKCFSVTWRLSCHEERVFRGILLAERSPLPINL